MLLAYYAHWRLHVTSSCPGRLRGRARRGFTLIELAACVALVAVLAAIGYGSFRNSMPRYRMIQTAKELRADLMALRMTAIETNRQSRLLLVDSDPDWGVAGSPNVGHWKLQLGNKNLRSTSWDTFPADADEDGVDDSTQRGTVDIGQGGEDETATVSMAPWGTLVGPGVNNADAIVFGPRGHVFNPASDFGQDGTITLTLVNKRALLDGTSDTVDLKVSRSGLVRMISSIAPEETLDFSTDQTTSMGGS